MKENYIVFYAERFNYAKSYEDTDIKFLPAILKHRLSNFDRLVLCILNKTYYEDIENILLSSQYGEIERLQKIIAQYTQFNEVSPNAFTGSVHNYIPGIFLINAGKSIPYNSISSHGQSVSTGILVSAISKFDKTLFCYSDVCDKISGAMALIISKIPSSNAIRYKIKIHKNNYKKDDFKQYVKVFTGDEKYLNTPLFTLERVE